MTYSYGVTPYPYNVTADHSNGS